MPKCKVRKPYEKGFYVINSDTDKVEGLTPNLPKAVELAKALVHQNPKDQYMVMRAVRVAECR